MRNFLRGAAKYILLTSLPLAVLVVLVYYYASDIPIFDEWEIAHLLDKFYSGTLTFRDIIAQHNEHRIVLTKIIILLNAILTGWNMYVEYAVNILFALGTSVVIYYAISKLQNLSSVKKMILYFTSAFMILSFSQFENFLWGFQMQIYMSVFFNVLAAALLVYGGSVAFLFAVLSAVLATYSFGNGVAVWPIGLFLLVVPDYVDGRKLNTGRIIFWLMATAASIYFYFFHDYNTLQPPLSEKLRFFLTHPHVVIILFFSYLGVAVSNYRQSVALAAGIAGTAFHLYCVITLIRHRIKDRNIFFWLAADMYVFLSAALTVYGRYLTIAATMARRYISINMLFWVITPCLFFLTLEHKKRVPLKSYLLFAALILVMSLSEDPLIKARGIWETRTVFIQQIRQGIYDDENFRHYIYPRRTYAQRFIPVLRKYGIRNFENAPDIEFDDFKPASLVSGDIADTEGVSFSIDECDYNGGYIYINGKAEDMRRSKVFLVLYNSGGAFEAELYEPFLSKRLTGVTYSDPYAVYRTKLFAGELLYYGSLESGTYRMALRAEDPYGHNYYHPLDATVSVQRRSTPLNGSR